MLFVNKKETRRRRRRRREQNLIAVCFFPPPTATPVRHIKHCVGFPLYRRKMYLLKHIGSRTKTKEKEQQLQKIAEHIIYHKIDKEITVHATVLFKITAFAMQLIELTVYVLFFFYI